MSAVERKPAKRQPAGSRPTPDPVYFPSAAAFGRWLATHHAKAEELWVGYYKVGSGKPSLTWPESVDEALCVGWIDGIRRSVDAMRYIIRFTPRRPTSHWSAVNVRRVHALTAEGRMRPAGLAAFAARTPERTGTGAFERLPVELPAAYDRLLKRHRAAWTFFHACTASYRKTVTWWVMSAKQEETRLRRLAQLIEHSAHERAIPQYTRPVKAAGAPTRGAAKRKGT